MGGASFSSERDAKKAKRTSIGGAPEKKKSCVSLFRLPPLHLKIALALGRELN